MNAGDRVQYAGFGTAGTIKELGNREGISCALVKWDPPLGHESWKAVSMLLPMAPPTPKDNVTPEQPAVMRMTLLDLHVCVPDTWTDERTQTWVNNESPAGTEHGWELYQDGAERLVGTPSRVKCADRAGYVHRVLGC